MKNSSTKTAPNGRIPDINELWRGGRAGGVGGGRAGGVGGGRAGGGGGDTANKRKRTGRREGVW